MPRPHVDRVPLSIRPRRHVYEPFAKKAERSDLSLNAAVEAAMRDWVISPLPGRARPRALPLERSEVTPIPKATKGAKK